jgi:hypothetical protein
MDIPSMILAPKTCAKDWRPWNAGRRLAPKARPVWAMAGLGYQVPAGDRFRSAAAVPAARRGYASHGRIQDIQISHPEYWLPNRRQV